MRIKRYASEKYFFEVTSRPIAEGIVFTITAIDRISGKRSDINNLNGIITAFDLEEDDPREEESDWLLSEKEIVDFQLTAGRILRSKRWLERIESELDDDRSQGEWANTHQVWDKWLKNHLVDTERANG
jgi:hypothetical protein